MKSGNGLRRRIGISWLTIVLALSTDAFTQELPVVKPETVGLSAERLERIATAVQRDIDGKRIAGAVTLVARHGRKA
jgi:hypothetical protein